MSIIIKYYARYRELTGKREEELQYDFKNISQVMEALEGKYPKLSKDEGKLVALNGRYANRDSVVKDGDSISLFPPVSGG
ncbi:MAG: MoaD/ThiS family protein [Candidatus Thermoplasmatota archaeon]|jgi:molybdopterin synthase sulfur carrier subunit|nr:MoaD/ThiS family protein [Candidatus Thermoplasmatota archaeon]